MAINSNIKDLKRQADIIKGDELYIINILEKWGVSENDIQNVQNKIATIQTRTVELYKNKEEHDAYLKKFGSGNKSLKSQGIHKAYNKRIYQVYKDGKLLMEDINARVCRRFGIDKGALSKIKDEGKTKGYTIVVKEVKNVK